MLISVFNLPAFGPSSKVAFYEQVTDVKWFLSLSFHSLTLLPLLLVVKVDPRRCLSTVFLFAARHFGKYVGPGQSHGLSLPKTQFCKEAVRCEVNSTQSGLARMSAA